MKDVTIQRVAPLSPETRRRLYDLHAAFFDNTSFATFESDLDEKDYIITATDAGSFVAFSTIKLHRECVDSRQIIFVFSGDTIVHPDHWSRNTITPAFAAFLGWVLRGAGSAEVYWFLITKGYRTYMSLPVFFETFYPQPDAPTPPECQALLDAIACKRYGACYDPRTGIISFGGTRDYLNETLRQVPDVRSRGRHVAFFLEKNPGFVRGDELACITRIDPENVRPAARGLLHYTGVRWEI